MPEAAPLVVIDTNVFVAAGFKPHSHAAALVALLRSGRLRLAWDDATRTETRHVLQRIPPLDWANVAGLFQAGRRFASLAPPDIFNRICDPSDRKFAALAQIAGAPLVSNDADLLSVRDDLPVTVWTPREAFAALTGP